MSDKKHLNGWEYQPGGEYGYPAVLIPMSGLAKLHLHVSSLNHAAADLEEIARLIAAAPKMRDVIEEARRIFHMRLALLYGQDDQGEALTKAQMVEAKHLLAKHEAQWFGTVVEVLKQVEGA